MKIKGILFDKDGTLIDFYSLWLQIADRIVPEFLKENQITLDKEHICMVKEALGILENYIDPHGAIACKSNQEIAEGISEALATKEIQIDSKKARTQIVRLFEETMLGGEVEFQAFTDLPKLFLKLKERGIRLGIATADTLISTKHCAKKLQIEQLLDYIGADDGVVRAKPETDMFEIFCSKYGLEPEEVAVVGDTYNDMRFAKNCKAKAIGVLSGVSQKEDFQDLADVVIPSVEDILSILE